jgi:hypothetical protein
MPVSVDGVNGITFNDATTFNSASSLGMRNRIINGNMGIWQRGTSFTSLTTSGTFSADRFYLNCGTIGTGVFSMTQSTDVPSGSGFPYSILFQATTAISSLASATYATINQCVEGINAADLAYGTAGAKTITLSYWVKTSFSGTLSGGIIQRNASTQRVFPWTYPVTNGTWTKVVVTIPGDTGGTIPYSNAIGFEIDFGYMAIGSNYSSGTPFIWNVNSSGNSYSSQTYNYFSSTSNTFQITGVQLEVGSVATAFDYRHYGTEFLLCQRYYQQYVNPPLKGVGNGTTNIYRCGMPMLVPMRASPTFAISGTLNWYDGTGIGTVTSIQTAYTTSPSAIEFDFQAATGTTATSRPIIFYVQSGTTGYISASAEIT